MASNTADYSPLFAEKKCLCGAWRGQHIMAAIDGDAAKDSDMLCPPEGVPCWSFIQE